MHTAVSRGFVLRKFGKRFDAANRLGLMTRVHSFAGTSSGGYGGLLSIVCAIALIVAVIGLAFHPLNLANLHLSSAVLTGFGAMGITAPAAKKPPPSIRQMEADVKALAKELEVGQNEMAAGPISQTRGEELEEKAQEMETLQKHIDRYRDIAGTLERSKKMDAVTLPSGDGEISRKRIATTPGHRFVMSDELAQFKAAGMTGGFSRPVLIGKGLGQRVMLSGQDAVDFEKKAFNSADLGAYGTDSIIPVDRDPELVRYAEPEILTIRQFLTSVPTTSDAVKYVKYTTTQRAADTQVNRGDPKAFLRMNTTLLTVNVETIAVLSKVTEQDIDDAPRLVGLINGEMTLDTKVEEEQQIVWGSGTGELAGIFASSNSVAEFNRAAVGDTVIDTIRKMRTDLRKNRVFPNFVAIDPIDWEGVELAKGTTNYYIWGLVSDMRGPRIWSIAAVESDAMTNRETGERRVLIGDGPRGATIYDRMGVQLAVGFMDDDFGRNLRTLRCEERLALAVKRPFAFEFSTTKAPNS